MAYDELIPGLTAFMEDDDSSDSDAEEKIEDAKEEAEHAEADADLAREDTEATEDESNAEAATAMFERLAVMEEHVKRYGVDRTFLSLCNYDNSLSYAFGIHLPSAESFDAVGNPHSAESIACLEGFADQWKKLKDFAKRIWEKFKNWVDRMVTKLSNFFKFSQESYGRVLRMVNAAKAKNWVIKDSKAGSKEVPDLAQLAIMNDAINKAVNASQSASGGASLTGKESDTTTTDSAVKAYDTKHREAMTALRNAKYKFADRTVAVRKIQGPACEGWMASWLNFLKVINTQEKYAKEQKDTVYKEFQYTLKELESADKPNKNKVANVKRLMQMVNISRSHATSLIPYVTWTINQMRKTIVARCRLTLDSDAMEGMDEAKKGALPHVR